MLETTAGKKPGRDWSQEGQLQKHSKPGSSAIHPIFCPCQPLLPQPQPLYFSGITSSSPVTVTCPHLSSSPVSLILFSLTPDWFLYYFSTSSPPFPSPNKSLSQMSRKTHMLWFPLLREPSQFVLSTFPCVSLYKMQILWGGNYLPLHGNAMPSEIRSCFCWTLALMLQIQLFLGILQKH